jgi:quercetin dioxygenase-like cupin family protein
MTAPHRVSFTILTALSLACGCAARNRPPTPAKHPTAAAVAPTSVRVSTLMSEMLPQPAPTQARLLRVNLPPLAASTPHRHPGAVFVYVAEGEVESALDDEPPTTYRAGQTWYERPGRLHRVSRNPSPTRPATLIVFFLTDPGQPVRVEAPSADR